MLVPARRSSAAQLTAAADVRLDDRAPSNSAAPHVAEP